MSLRASHLREVVVGGALAVSLALLCVECKVRKTEDPMDRFAHRYLQLTVALGERDPDSLDFYFGPEAEVAGIRSQLPTIKAIAIDAAGLRSQLHTELVSKEDISRFQSLDRQIETLRCRAEMLVGAVHNFDEEALTLFGARVPPDTAQAERARTRAEIAHLLVNSSNPAHAYTLYDRQFAVAPEKVPAVLNAALQACRAQTLKHVQLPAGEHVDVEYVFHKPWSAYSRYLGHAHSLIQVNMEFPLTVDRVLNLACHEGYPGHHVFNTLRDESLVQQAHQQEWMAQPTFSPQSYVSEAAASYAPQVVFSQQQRLAVERDLLFPIAGLDPRGAERYLQIESLVDSLATAEPAIARDYLDGHLEFVRAADALERETLMEHAETMLLYLNEYRTYMLTYTVGRQQIQSIVERDNPSPEVRWSRYVELMRKPVTSLE